jgi:hypothetical protein
MVHGPHGLTTKGDAGKSQANKENIADGNLFDELIRLLGIINYSWTNTESLLIHLIAGLAQVDKEIASIMFLTLNTTRARLNLVERLAKRDCISNDERKAILSLTNDMSSIVKTKNHYNHCIYSFDQSSQKASTILMRIFDKKDEIKYGRHHGIDTDEVSRLKAVVTQIEDLNNQVWSFLKEHKYPL